MRKKITNLTTNKAFLIVISGILSVFIWLYVVSVENQDIEITVSNIPVSYVGIGENEILADRNLFVRNPYDETVTLTITGRRARVTSLNNTNIIVTVDLTDIRNEGTFDKGYTITLPNNLTERDVTVRRDTPNVAVTVDRMLTRLIKVTGSFVGTIAEGYMGEDMIFSPEFVSVRGPAEILNDIENAEVVINRENLSKTIDIPYEYTFVDSNGNEVPKKELTYDYESINVIMQVKMMKEVFLKLNIREGGGAKESDVKYECTPESIMLAGDPAVLEGLNQLIIGSVDLSRVDGSLETTFNLDNIPNDAVNMTGITDINVKLNIVGLETKRLDVTRIEYINKPEGYTVASLTHSLNITVRGSRNDLARVESYNVRMVIDLEAVEKDLGRPTSAVPRFYVDGFENVGVVLNSNENLNKFVFSLAKEVEISSSPSPSPSG